MSEYIARPSLMAKLTSSETQSAMREMDGSQAYSFFLAMVNSEPAADVVEVKHASWKYCKKQGIAVCTHCSFERKLDDDFGRAVSCPNCGAKMDGE